jgi:putative sigma-54 modulation protein
VKVTITGRHMHVHDSIREYAEEKAQKLERYFEALRTIEIVFSHEGDLKQVEMIAHPRKGDVIVGQTSHDDQFAAIDLLIDKMYNQLHKLKEKIIDRRKRSERVAMPPSGVGEVKEPEVESYDEVMDKYGKRFDGK